MQNVCFRRKDTPLHAEQRTKCAPVAQADSIIVLNQEEIVEHRTWQTLLSRLGSLFAGMVQAGAG